MKISLRPLNDSNEIPRILIDPKTPIAVCRAKTPNQCLENNLFLLPKVISRKHAIIYEKEFTVYLQDTKSSGGTWVNGNRLSPSGIESNPQIIVDDDIIQFGEDTDYDGSLIKAVCFRINITECKPEPSIGKPDIVLQNKLESQDHSSQSIEIREKIKIINPLPNVDLATSPIVKNTKILTNSSILQSSSLGNTAIHDQNSQKETSHLGIRNQSMKIHKVLELPLLPQLPNHIQEELNTLWTPLEVIASPFKEAELLLSSNKS